MKLVQSTVLILFVIAAAAATGCSTAGVEARQQGISNTQGRVLDNRAARIEARDARFRASRDLIMQ